MRCVFCGNTCFGDDVGINGKGCCDDCARLIARLSGYDGDSDDDWVPGMAPVIEPPS